MKRIWILSVLLISALSVKAEYQNHTTEDYIEMWKSTAIEQMHQYNIPASITLAQGILESGNGNSKLARHANNHFGIKCHENWSGGTFYQDDDEANECFRSYSQANESYLDHSEFLKNRPRYSNLFTLSVTDYKGWAHGLKSAGYATNPKYASLLIELIEKYDLDQYDLIPKPEKKEDLVAVSEEPVTTIDEVETPVSAEEISLSETGHKVYQNHKRVHYIVVQKGDTYYRIAEEFNLGMWQLYKYNELGQRDVLREGEIIYLSPKSSRAGKGNNVHVCERDMSLREVSQLVGIKLDKLLEYNFSDNPDEILPKGTKVILR
ncbi:MAG: glucosaminidase domain-containing protein [Crocinitomicaceae bacterium]|nr:glucosaminidase domain-containing protein [Crocinitomicaceae bacterium]MBK8925356.1 glucosaminidase domain-containing protein [Crocinitomicaceae bacterium]